MQVNADLSRVDQARNWVRGNFKELGITAIMLVALGAGLLIAGAVMEDVVRGTSYENVGHLQDVYRGLIWGGFAVTVSTIAIFGGLACFSIDEKEKTEPDLFKRFKLKEGDYSKVAALVAFTIAAIGIGLLIGGLVMKGEYNNLDLQTRQNMLPYRAVAVDLVTSGLSIFAGSLGLWVLGKYLFEKEKAKPIPNCSV